MEKMANLQQAVAGAQVGNLRGAIRAPGWHSFLRTIPHRLKPPVLLSLFMVALTLGSSAVANEPLHWSQLPPLPDALGVAGPFAGVSGDTLLVAGGANFPGRMLWEGGKKVWHDEVYGLTAKTNRWVQVGKLPRPLAYGVSITTGQGLIIIGGSDADRHYGEVYQLNYLDGKLLVKNLPALPLPLANAAGALVGSTIYVAGGSEHPGEQAAVSQVFSLALAEENPTWKQVPACPGKARILPVAAAWKNAFYLFGGAALEATNGKIARSYLHDAWRYQPELGWQRLADLPKPCVAGPTPAPKVGEDFLLVGGDDGALAGFQPPERHPGFPKLVLAYDVNGDRWYRHGEVPAPRATVPAVYWQGLYVIPSGEMRPGVRSPEVWALATRGEP